MITLLINNKKDRLFQSVFLIPLKRVMTCSARYAWASGSVRKRFSLGAASEEF